MRAGSLVFTSAAPLGHPSTSPQLLRPKFEIYSCKKKVPSRTGPRPVHNRYVFPFLWSSGLGANWQYGHTYRLVLTELHLKVLVHSFLLVRGSIRLVASLLFTQHHGHGPHETALAITSSHEDGRGKIPFCILVSLVSLLSMILSVKSLLRYLVSIFKRRLVADGGPHNVMDIALKV